MAGLEADTSSYNMPLPVSPLKTVQELGALKQQQQQIESGGLTIDNQKVELANKALAALGTAVTSLGPNATKEQYKAVGENVAKAFNLPPQAIQSWNQRIDSAATPQEFYNQAVTAIGDHQAAVSYHLGTRQDINNGQSVTPAVTSIKPGFGVKPIAAPIQRQLGPETDVVTPAGTQKLGPQAPQLPVGVAPVRGGVPGQMAPAPSQALPVADRNASAAASNPAAFESKNGYKPTGPMTSQPPMFEEGKKQLAEDQALAAQKLTAIKPPIQALSMMKDLRSGPGTETYNKAVAFLKANGILPTQANDPTAIYQEVNKYLSQYVQGSGTRSDADLASREASSPNVGTQINPALVKLTKNAIALDRVQAARAAAYESPDLSGYGNHRANFPAQIDERAFGIDLMEPKERQALLSDMKKKANTPEGQKFWKSLKIADKQGLLNQ